MPAPLPSVVFEIGIAAMVDTDAVEAAVPVMAARRLLRQLRMRTLRLMLATVPTSCQARREGESGVGKSVRTTMPLPARADRWQEKMMGPKKTLVCGGINGDGRNGSGGVSCSCDDENEYDDDGGDGEEKKIRAD